MLLKLDLPSISDQNDPNFRDWRPFMRKGSALSVAIILALFLLVPAIHAKSIILNNAPTLVCFSPNGGCTEAAVKEIAKAKSEILLQIYSFTSTPIAKALVDAHKREVKVEAILDKSQRSEKYSSATFLGNSRIPTFIDARHAIAHNKIMIIDRGLLGSSHFHILLPSGKLFISFHKSANVKSVPE
jgi:hypothetical protein